MQSVLRILPTKFCPPKNYSLLNAVSDDLHPNETSFFSCFALDPAKRLNEMNLRNAAISTGC